jgi:hypothetical protein
MYRVSQKLCTQFNKKRRTKLFFILFYFCIFGRVHSVVFINLKDKIVLVSGFSQTQLHCCESVQIANKMQPCNRIYYS